MHGKSIALDVQSIAYRLKSLLPLVRFEASAFTIVASPHDIELR